VASGQALLVAMLALFVCDVLGGLFTFASGVHTFDKAWGFNAKSAVPLPVAAVQLGLAWLAARNVRPPIGLIAAVLLAVFCAISEVAGMFDGDLAEKISAHGWLSWQVLWGVVLLAVNLVVAVLAGLRARQLGRR